MSLDFLAIALLDKNIKNWNKMGGRKGQWLGPCWMGYVIGVVFVVVVRLGPEYRSALHPMGCIHFQRLMVAIIISCATTRICC